MRFAGQVILVAVLMFIFGALGKSSGNEWNGISLVASTYGGVDRNGKSYGAECYHSAPAVRADHPGAWPSWSQRLSGHAGQKCWFPTERQVVPDGKKSVKPNMVSTHDTPRPRSSSAAGVVPFPRAMPFELQKERALEEMIPFNERWAGLYLSWR
jgi:hypothetical protein